MWRRGSAPPGRISSTGTTGASTRTCAQGLERMHSRWGLLMYPPLQPPATQAARHGPRRPGRHLAFLQPSARLLHPSSGAQRPGGLQTPRPELPPCSEAAVRLGGNPGSREGPGRLGVSQSRANPLGTRLTVLPGNAGPWAVVPPERHPLWYVPGAGLPLRESLGFFVFKKACVDSGNRSPPVGRDPGWGKGTAARPEVWGVDSPQEDHTSPNGGTE